FANAGPESVWVSNADDAESQRRVRGVTGRHLRFSVRSRADGWYDRSGDLLQLGDVALLPRPGFPLLGDHNVANALAAALAVRVVQAGCFEEVLRLARELARPGDAVLLSPACSSYDMFTNYEERGARFRAIVEGWR